MPRKLLPDEFPAIFWPEFGAIFWREGRDEEREDDICCDEILIPLPLDPFLPPPPPPPPPPPFPSPFKAALLWIPPPLPPPYGFRLIKISILW